MNTTNTDAVREALSNVEVMPPNADGNVYLIFFRGGISRYAAVNLGKADSHNAVVAAKWEQYRQRALTASRYQAGDAVVRSAQHAAVRKVLQHHGLTKHGDAVVEADIIDAIAKATAKD